MKTVNKLACLALVTGAAAYAWYARADYSYTVARDCTTISATAWGHSCAFIGAKSTARKKAEEAALAALKADCASRKTASGCTTTCENAHEDYSGYGVWSSVTYTVLDEEKKRTGDCGWDVKVRATGDCCCMCWHD